MVEPEKILLSEVSQPQKAKNRMFSLIYEWYNQNKCSNISGHGLNAKGRTRIREIGKERKPKT
jgi:hypothetical protein